MITVSSVSKKPRAVHLRRMKYASTVTMGQSPKSENCNVDGDGVPFLQGNAEFGTHSPAAKQFCPVATKVVPRGTLLLSVRAPVGAFNIADQQYGIGRGLCGIKPDEVSLLLDFAWYLVSVIREELNTIATGSTYEAVTADEVASMVGLLPPPDEQRAIAAFLDRETGRIDGLIEKKERQIALLQEKRSALISRAVTKGLDPNTPMKDSGIEWLGQIPKHWETRKLKYLIEGGLVNGLFKKNTEFGAGTKLLNVFDVYREDFIVDHNSLDRVNADSLEQRKYSVQPGDVFFVRSSLKLEGVGRSVCVLDVPEPTVFECHVVRARPDQKTINPAFLINYLNSNQAINRFVSLANFVTMATIDQDTIKSVEVALPPREEQDAIAEELDREWTITKQLQSTISESIDMLREHRTALISAAVTGKIDVRGEVA